MNTPSSNKELTTQLKELLKPELHSRPFICDGSPFNMALAIIGINPKSMMTFWDFWDEKTGFDRKRWRDKYSSTPKAKRNATRNRINLFIDSANSLRIIELNAYPYATSNEATISEEMKDSRVLDLMLRVAKPRAIFIFGREPARVISSLFEIEPPEFGSKSVITYKSNKFILFTESHFSRGWSYAQVEAKASEITECLN